MTDLPMRASARELYERWSKNPRPEPTSDQINAVLAAVETCIQGHWTAQKTTTEIFTALGFEAPDLSTTEETV